MSATQVITIEQLTDYRIQVPGDEDVSCDAQVFTDFQLFASQGCDLVAVSTTEATVDALDDPETCFQIERIHQLVNWCQYDGSSPVTELPRRDGADPDLEIGDAYEIHVLGNTLYWLTSSGTEVELGEATGYYQYQQWIDIYDDQLPQLVFTAPAAFCTPLEVEPDADPCNGAVDFPFELSDNCSEAIEYLYSLNLNNETLVADEFGSIQDQGNGLFHLSGSYPVGNHAIQITLFDDCGNANQYDLPFEIQDCTPPALTCTDIPEYNLQFDGTRTFEPSDFVEFMEDNCSAISLSFSPEEVDMIRTYTCDSIGTKTLTIWATDNSGNQTSCTVNFEIGDDVSACIEYYSINGNIRTEFDIKVEQSDVRLSGPLEMEYASDVVGDFLFVEVPEDSNYVLRPRKDTEANNGVSTLDMVFINQHILGIKNLDSPYKIIAADANRSGSVSTLDQVFIRRVILGIDTAFFNNTSWRFIPEDFEFSNDTDPFLDDFPEEYQIDALSSDTSINFTAVKVGDVNGSASGDLFLGELEEREGVAPTAIRVEDQMLTAGAVYDFYFEAKDADLSGFQFTLDFDPNLLEFLAVLPTQQIGPDHFGLQRVSEGKIAISWAMMGSELATFDLRFRAKGEALLSQLLQINSDIIRAEAYKLEDLTNLALLKPVLHFEAPTSTAVFQVLQNQPNPFRHQTQIAYILPEDGTVELAIYSVEGRLQKRMEQASMKGLNHIQIDKSTLGKGGVYYYHLVFGTQKVVKKMVLVE